VETQAVAPHRIPTIALCLTKIQTAITQDNNLAPIFRQLLMKRNNNKLCKPNLTVSNYSSLLNFN